MRATLEVWENMVQSCGDMFRPYTVPHSVRSAFQAISAEYTNKIKYLAKQC